MISLKLSHLSVIMQLMMLFSVTWAIELVAAHLRKFSKECDSLRAQFSKVNVHICAHNFPRQMLHLRTVIRFSH